MLYTTYFYSVVNNDIGSAIGSSNEELLKLLITNKIKLKRFEIICYDRYPLEQAIENIIFSPERIISNAEVSYECALIHLCDLFGVMLNKDRKAYYLPKKATKDYLPKELINSVASVLSEISICDVLFEYKHRLICKKIAFESTGKILIKDGHTYIIGKGGIRLKLNENFNPSDYKCGNAIDCFVLTETIDDIVKRKLIKIEDIPKEAAQENLPKLLHLKKNNLQNIYSKLFNVDFSSYPESDSDFASDIALATNGIKALRQKVETCLRSNYEMLVLFM